MKSLPSPDGQHFAEFTCIAKSWPTLAALANNINGRYSDYQAKRKRLERVPIIELSADEKSAFKKAYATLRQQLNKEMSGVAAETALCPYCLIDHARDWDHFLPQAKFPDFGIYRPNLLRVCTRCNRMKGNRLVSKPRKALNPYFDPIDELQFLKCEVNTAHPLTAIFQVEVPAGTDPYFSKLIEEHFKAYGLARKYRAQATDQIAKLIQAIQFEVNHGAQLTRALAMKEVDKLAYVRGLGPNHWLIALAQGLRVAPNLLKYLKQHAT